MTIHCILDLQSKRDLLRSSGTLHRGSAYLIQIILCNHRRFHSEVFYLFFLGELFIGSKQVKFWSLVHVILTHCTPQYFTLFATYRKMTLISNLLYTYVPEHSMKQCMVKFFIAKVWLQVQSKCRPARWGDDEKKRAWVLAIKEGSQRTRKN